MILDIQKKAYIQIHIAVILFGFTAILGDLIQLPAIVLVWWRVLITSASLIFFIQWGRTIISIPKALVFKYALIGGIIGLHWICFYGSIKLANASISLICMATTSFFTAILEPIMVRKKFNLLEVTLGLCIIPGMVLIVKNIDLSYVLGFWVGMLSAFLAAIFSILNKKYIKGSDPYTISFIELSSAWVMISLLLVIMYFLGKLPTSLFPPTYMDWFYLILLSLLCTTLAQVLALKALDHISAFASNLVVNLEPVYGIILAVILLNEHHKLDPMFYVGGSIILISVLLYPYLNKRINLQKPI